MDKAPIGIVDQGHHREVDAIISDLESPVNLPSMESLSVHDEAIRELRNATSVPYDPNNDRLTQLLMEFIAASTAYSSKTSVEQIITLNRTQQAVREILVELRRDRQQYKTMADTAEKLITTFLSIVEEFKRGFSSKLLRLQLSRNTLNGLVQILSSSYQQEMDMSGNTSDSGFQKEYLYRQVGRLQAALETLSRNIEQFSNQTHQTAQKCQFLKEIVHTFQDNQIDPALTTASHRLKRFRKPFLRKALSYRWGGLGTAVAGGVVGASATTGIGLSTVAGPVGVVVIASLTTPIGWAIVGGLIGGIVVIGGLGLATIKLIKCLVLDQQERAVEYLQTISTQMDELLDQINKVENVMNHTYVDTNHTSAGLDALISMLQNPDQIETNSSICRQAAESCDAVIRQWEEFAKDDYNITWENQRQAIAEDNS